MLNTLSAARTRAPTIGGGNHVPGNKRSDALCQSDGPIGLALGVPAAFPAFDLRRRTDLEDFATASMSRGSPTIKINALVLEGRP
jgi:hypothetical protein